MIAHTVQPYRRYRITLLHDVDMLDDAAGGSSDVEVVDKWSIGVLRFDVLTTITPAGTVYEGVASSVDADGFFELRLDTGEVLGIYAGDDSLQTYGTSTVALFRKDHRNILGVCLARLSLPSSDTQIARGQYE